jgi:hypothetical protein
MELGEFLLGSTGLSSERGLCSGIAFILLDEDRATCFCMRSGGICEGLEADHNIFVFMKLSSQRAT